MKTKLRKLVFGVLLLAAFSSLAQTETPSPTTVLFQNVRIFDGKSDRLGGPTNVLVRGNTIEKISAQAIPTDRRADTVIIDGGGRTLMPGLIDMHWHTMLVRPTVAQLLSSDIGYLNLIAGAEANDHSVVKLGGRGNGRGFFQLIRTGGCTHRSDHSMLWRRSPG